MVLLQIIRLIAIQLVNGIHGVNGLCVMLIVTKRVFNSVLEIRFKKDMVEVNATNLHLKHETAPNLVNVNFRIGLNGHLALIHAALVLAFEQEMF